MNTINASTAFRVNSGTWTGILTVMNLTCELTYGKIVRVGCSVDVVGTANVGGFV